MPTRLYRHFFSRLSALPLCVLLGIAPALAEEPAALLQQLNTYPHAVTVESSETQMVDYEIGLGAIEKVSGSWRFKRSERNSGLLTRYTWQIIDGFTSIEVMNELLAKVESNGESELLYSCDGRSCGQGVQWANRVFRQRILYGREDLQRYRVYQLAGESAGVGEDEAGAEIEAEAGGQYRLIIYSASRSSERQYLHVELLQLTP